MARARSKGEHGRLVSILMGAGLSLLVLIIVSLIVSAVVYMMDDPLAVIDIGSLIALLISGLISSFIISRRTREGKMLITILSSLLLVILMLIVCAIIGMGTVNPRVVLNYVCYMGVTLIGGWLGAKGKRRRR